MSINIGIVINVNTIQYKRFILRDCRINDLLKHEIVDNERSWRYAISECYWWCTAAARGMRARRGGGQSAGGLCANGARGAQLRLLPPLPPSLAYLSNHGPDPAQVLAVRFLCDQLWGAQAAPWITYLYLAGQTPVAPWSVWRSLWLVMWAFLWASSMQAAHVCLAAARQARGALWSRRW